MEPSLKKWNISFAGCGFLMAYYCGVYRCLAEQAPFLLKRVTSICGASSGALMGALVACQLSPDKCCEKLLEMSREARKGPLGAVHPSFSLLKTVERFLIQDLPTDAHHHATGRLFVSLTRVSDGSNVLVSQFDSREDLIQALICSCFYPLYCGVIPPRYHGIRYADGALSNNVPLSNLKNTITISPFSGESDICPRGDPSYFQEIHYNNLSIHISLSNAHRVTTAFFPPEPKVLTQICQNGFKDAFHFLIDNELVNQSPLSDVTNTLNGFTYFRRPFIWDSLLTRDYNDLPDFQKVSCSANRVENEDTFPPKLVSWAMWWILPVEIMYYWMLRFSRWTEMWSDLLWMWETAKHLWRKAFSKRLCGYEN